MAIFFLVIISVFYLSGFAIAKRPDRAQDRWPQVRILAKTRDGFRTMGCSDSTAIFLTEAISGSIHAMATWGTLNLIGPLNSWALWGAGFVSVFWLGLGAGQAIAAEHREAARKNAGNEVKGFLQNPIPCLLPHRQAACSAWSDDDCDDLYVRFDDVSVAYVQNIRFDPKTHIVTIGHFAVAEGLERQGIGRRLAHVLRSEFAWRFQATEIRFEENSRRYDDAGYAPFFRSLGAIPVQHPQSNRPDWHWNI
jgi:GNAT superfamily N-acetyltransferase